MLREKFTRFPAGFVPSVDASSSQVHATRGFLLFGTLHAWRYPNSPKEVQNHEES